MDRRLLLHQALKDICPNVYFQPPTNVQMEYPAIVYERGRADTKFADDLPYSRTPNYSLNVISKNPDEAILEELAVLPMCAHERHFVVDNLNHDVFSIYF
jgi:hypothetical protein